MYRGTNLQLEFTWLDLHFANPQYSSGVLLIPNQIHYYARYIILDKMWGKLEMRPNNLGNNLLLAGSFSLILFQMGRSDSTSPQIVSIQFCRRLKNTTKFYDFTQNLITSPHVI